MEDSSATTFGYYLLVEIPAGYCKYYLKRDMIGTHSPFAAFGKLW